MEAQSAWGVLVAAYLFLGGLSGGVLACAGIAECLRPGRLKKAFRPSLWIALALLAAGVMCLLFDLGVPVRGLLLWRSFSNMQSWLSLGAWTLAGALALVLALDVCNSAGAPKLARRVLAGLVALAGVAVMAYTGALLASCSAVAAWTTPLLVALFVASGVSCGASFVACAVRLREKKGKVRKCRPFRNAEAVALGVEAMVLAAWLAWMTRTGEVAAASAQVLLSGSLTALLFWAGVVGLGIAVPAVLNVIALACRKELLAVCIASCVFTLAGSAALRWCVLACGLRAVAGLAA